MRRDFEALIGLEIHAQLLTETKMFCACSTAFGAEPNTQVCPVCLGLPGALPVANRKAVELAILVGVSLQSTVNPTSIFARKNYFYPDLPKNYQISQYDAPLCSGGHLELTEGAERRPIRLTRVHLEEDAAKSIHSQECSAEATLLDFNRCGVPLIEIVTYPDIRSASEAHAFLTALRQLLRYVRASSGNMEEGSLRCDVNVSVRKVGDETLRTKSEIKNLNSFKNVAKAIDYEIERQIEVSLSGGTIAHETLLWDASREKAVLMRSKEEAHDYRYFPEPDLLVLRVSPDDVERIRRDMPELPAEKVNRFVESYGLPEYDAAVLSASREVADYFEEVVRGSGEAKLASNWIMTELLREAKTWERGFSEMKVPASDLAELLTLVREGTVSGKMAKEILGEMLASGKGPSRIVSEKGLSQITDIDELRKVAREVIVENPDAVSKYFKGRERSFGFLVGQLMKKTKGKANPPLANEALKKELQEPERSSGAGE